ncbi:MAG: response regulator [Pirellulales bacterium]
MRLSDKSTFEREVEQKVLRHADSIQRRVDRLFAVLMPLQWIAGIAAALFISPQTWIGAKGQVHPHVLFAIFGGALLGSLPVALAVFRPGKLSTRLVIACSQVLFSSLLIHLTGGRIETHFHVFGSLAFLAAYRDWRVLVPATLIVAADHFLRGVWWSETVFGVAAAENWRWLEHAAWVVFEDVFLILIILQSVREMHELARHTTQVELTAETLAQRAEEIRKLSLVASEARYGVVITDPQQRAEWVNDSFIQMTGFTAGEIIGREPWTLLHGPHTDPVTAERVREQLRQQRSVGVELINYAKDGREFWTSLKIEPVFDEDGRLTNFISTQTNISDRKEREAELRRAKEESESANRAKSQFLANMSHEIRTPLNGILGFTELLRVAAAGISETERQDYLQTISSSGRHLLTLINDILDISKIEAGHLLVENVRCSPHQIIAEVVSVLRVPAQEKGLCLDYRWESGIPESIMSDPFRLKQLLMNLLGNAIKFTEQGSVIVVASLDATTVSQLLRIEVRDTGMGIPSDKLDMIFEPFAQADSSVTRKHGGTGLGLAITRRIAEALGGTLVVTSELGRGSAFAATVATGDLSGISILEKPPQDTIGDVIPQESAMSDLTGLNVLLVEDGDTNRKLLRVTLTRGGASVATAENGKIALHLATEQSFDVILMDMQMPVMDGYTATRILRERGFTKPIIALTAHAMKGDREKCQEAGCSGYLTKPINLGTLVHTVLEATSAAGSTATRPRAAGRTARTAARPPAKVESSLPVNDPEIGAIVREFVDKLSTQIEQMNAANSNRNYVELAELAHWLKGAGGTVGFDCFTEPALQLEQFAKEGNDAEIGGIVRQLRSLHEVVVS